MTHEVTRRSIVASLSSVAGTAAAGRSIAGSGIAVDPKRLLTHRFGVNYVPSKQWYYSYNAWNRTAISDDLSRIAEIGADHIRVMVVWPWFQPNPKAMSEVHLDRLDTLVELAAAQGLSVFPSLFTGWLSGYHFNPNFYDEEPFYTSPKWEQAQSFYIEALTARMRRHPNFNGFDLGNELACSWKASNLEGDAWMGRRLGQIRASFPDKVHVNGVDHSSWFSDDTFSAQALVAEQDIVALHCWPFWTGAANYGGPLDKPYTHLLGGMAALARSLGNAPSKPVWAQEFGACTLEMPEADLLTFMDRAITTGVDTGVSWFTWWASHDVDKRYEFHPFEYSLGLIDTNNRIKPQGRAFRTLADRYRGRPIALPTNQLLPAPPKTRNNSATWTWLLEWMAQRHA